MEDGGNYPWQWHPVFKDYYMFRRRGVAGTTDTDLIWARSMIKNDEQASGSPESSAPPSRVDPNESIATNTRNLLGPNNDRAFSYYPMPNSQLPSSPKTQPQLRELSQTVPMDLTKRTNISSSPPLYGFVVPFTSLTSGDGSTTSFSGLRTPTTSADTSSIPYSELNSEQSIGRCDEGTTTGANPLDSTATPIIDTFVPLPEVGFEIIRNPRNYFKKGRVFKVIWPEPKGELTLSAPRSTGPDGADTPTQSTILHTSDVLDTASASDGIGAASLHVKTRMFVVVRQKTQHCLCLPIYTYSQRGTSKSGIRAEDHAPLVKENSEVEFHPEEQHNQLKKSIYLRLEDTALSWSPLSRINLTKVQSIEYNLKVRTVGRVSPDCLADLEALFREAIGVNED